MLLCNQCGNPLGTESSQCPACGAQTALNKPHIPETVNSNFGSPPPAVLPAPSSEVAHTDGSSTPKYIIIALLALIAGGGLVALLRPNRIERVSSPSNASSPLPANDSKEDTKANSKGLVSVRQPTPSPAISQSSSGTWFVVLGSFPRSEREKADQRLQSVQGLGYGASIIDTDNYRGLRGGLWAVVMGPYSKAYAKRVADQIRGVRPDAYIKSGW